MEHSEYSRTHSLPLIFISIRTGLKQAAGVACCLGFCTNLWAQAVSGTVIVVERSKQKVIIAADSRANFGNGRYQDSACKITALSDRLIFAAAGIVSDSSLFIPRYLRFGAREQARRAFSAYSPTAKGEMRLDVVGQTASRWARLMGLRFARASRAAPGEVREWLRRIDPGHERTLTIGIFAGLESNGELEVVIENIEYTEQNTSAPVAVSMMEPFNIPNEWPDNVFAFRPFGRTRIVAEMLAGKTDRAMKEALAMRPLRENLSPNAFERLRAIRLVDLTIAYDPEPEFVGGPIDAIELARGGRATWIQRKSGCPAD